MTCLDIISDSTGKEIVAAIKSTDVAQARISEINQAAELKKNEVLASIPEDYRNTVDEVNQIKGDLDTERNARIEADTDHSTRLQNVELASSVNRYEIENLKAKAEGKLYRTETIEAEAYTVDVPSSVAPYAEVQKVGGKSVVWNQLVNARFSSPQSNVGSQGTLSKTDSYTKVNSIASTTRLSLGTTTKIPMVKGHKYYSHAILKVNGFSGNVKVFSDIAGTQAFTPTPLCQNNVWTTWDVLITRTGETTSGSGFSFYIDGAYTDDTKELYVKEFSIFDLTLMFGAGNEPTLEECRKIFSADYYPYDAGSLKSFPVQKVVSGGKNLLNYDEWKKVSINGGTGVFENNGVTITATTDDAYTDYKGSDTNGFRTKARIPIKEGQTITLSWDTDGTYSGLVYLFPNSNTTGMVSADSSNKKLSYTATSGITFITFRFGVYKQGSTVSYKNIQIELGSNATDFVPYRDPIEYDVSSVTTNLKSAVSVHDEWQKGKKIIRVGERAYTEGDESDSTLLTDGTNTYYPLESSIVEEVPEIDNYINVEGGGTLTFESDDAVHMPVPSTDRFVVDLTSTTEETT